MMLIGSMRTDMRRWMHAMGVALFATVLCVSSVSAAGKDTVKMSDGSVLRGVTVLKADTDAVAIDTTGDGKADRTVKGGDVADITWGDSPAEFRRGTFRVSTGSYQEAYELFSKAQAEKKARAFWLEPEAGYMMAECLRLQAEDAAGFTRAQDAYKAVLARAPKSLTVPAAQEGIARCLLGGGKVDEAIREFDKLVDGAPYGRQWALRGKLGKARALGVQGKPADAVKLAEEVMEATKGGTMPDLHVEARDARTGLLFDAGEYAKVREIYESLAAAAPAHDIASKADAWNWIGDTYLAENATKDALLSYLRVRVLYPNDKEQLARSLYGAARCFTIMKKSRESAELLGILETDYKDSVWTAKALKELGD